MQKGATARGRVVVGRVQIRIISVARLVLLACGGAFLVMSLALWQLHGNVVVEQQQQQQQRAKLHPEEQDELDMEQPSGEPTSKKTYKYRLLPWLDCCVFPRFIRAAPTWLKMIMMLSMSIIFFGLCLYAAAALLQAEFDDDGGSTTGTDETDVPASQVILEQGVEMFGWEDSLTLSPTAQVVVASLKKRTRSPP
mmetsp:Transcript_1195/g.2603  ORF Transcript_1195/g.2603 Transcript_1195/m.2603 type:complete len:195 (+) Transcript_1195:134-718(+)